MKKRLLLLAAVLFLGGSLSAQALYFDIGLGVGMATTKFDDQDVMDSLTEYDEIGVEVGLRLGYGPLFNIPLYLAGELSGIGHRASNDPYYYQFNSYLLGGSLIFYPISLLQISGSFGYSFVADDSYYNVVFPDSDNGYAWNISAALDLGKRNHGLLIGGKYSMAVNNLEDGTEQQQSLFSIFIKYAYRQKGSSRSKSSVDW